MQEADIQELFSAHGEVTSVKIIKDRFTGQSKGLGFIAMPNEEEALKAIAELNNYQIGHRKISVAKAGPRSNYLML
jgi:RNA recognition motif-containing protein